MKLLGAGRMGEVYAYGEGLVVKLDRPEWSGVAEFEAEILTTLAAAGLPVPRCQGAVMVEGRTGVVMERIDGGSLLDRVMQTPPEALPELATQFVDLQAMLTGTEVAGLPLLIERLANELQLAPLPDGLRSELAALLPELDDGHRGVCHFDLHPLNILVGAGPWKVIDWLGVGSGPPIADVMRTLLIWARWTIPPIPDFMAQVRSQSIERHGIDADTHDAWLRVLAGCRLAEGFEGEAGDWLLAVAAGQVTPYR
jgi:aminoglycoside phosphotransferase (APT) family kinase protein